MFGALCVWGAMTTPLHAQDQASEHFLYHRGETEVEMVTPPTPEAASRTRYVDIPVSYGMGTATMEVPIYELKGRHLSVPVRLSYRCGGIKADGLALVLNPMASLLRRLRTRPHQSSMSMIGMIGYALSLEGVLL